MAKKIRFPLEMDNGLEVRSMEELRNNFSLGRVLEYIQNGKLVIWLRDRYENNIAGPASHCGGSRLPDGRRHPAAEGPFNILKISGNSSRLVERRIRPNLGKRSSSGRGFPSLSHLSIIDLNLYNLKTFPFFPGLS